MNQMNIEQFASDAMENMMPHNPKVLWTVAAVMAGATLLGAGAYLAWNSRQAKTLRAAKRASKILYKAGTILQTVAEVAD